MSLWRASVFSRQGRRLSSSFRSSWREPLTATRPWTAAPFATRSISPPHHVVHLTPQQGYCSSAKNSESAQPPAQVLSKPLLSQNEQQLVAEEQQFLKNFIRFADDMGASKDDIQLLETSLASLDRLFSLVVVGEFNSGKSSFLNALLGSSFLEQGITPTTQKINIIQYGQSFFRAAENDETEAIYAPVEWLKEINVVDTPGTNAIVRTHEAITEHFIPQADLVLFVTSVERPFSESERLFLQRIGTWSKKVVIIISKIDQLQSPTELMEVSDFVEKNYLELTRTGALIFPVSARATLEQKLGKTPSPSSLPAKYNQFGDLETYIHKTLDAAERLQLKLSSPLGVCSKLANVFKKTLENQGEVIRGDIRLLDDINDDIEQFHQDMRRDFKYQESRVDNVLLRLRERGEAYLDSTLRLSNITLLMQSERMKSDFEVKVIKDTTAQIDNLVSDIIDWMVDRHTKQWKQIMSSLQSRKSAASESAFNFEVTRKELLASIGNDIHDIVLTYDKTQESNVLSKRIQQSMMQAVAIAGASALGMGALLSVSLLDFTGVLGASALAATGLCIIPYRRVTVKKEFDEKIDDLRNRIMSALVTHFEDEIQNSNIKIRDAISPFSSFVRKEQKNHKILSEELDQLSQKIEELQREVSSSKN